MTPTTDDQQAMRRLLEEYAFSQDPQFFLDNAVFSIQALPDAPSTGRPAIAALLRRLYHESFSEARVEVRNVALDSERHLGAMEFIFRGRHSGDLLGVAPTYQSVEVPMLAVYELTGGGIQAGRLYFDMASLQRQLRPAA